MIHCMSGKENTSEEMRGDMANSVEFWMIVEAALLVRGAEVISSNHISKHLHYEMTGHIDNRNVPLISDEVQWAHKIDSSTRVSQSYTPFPHPTPPSKAASNSQTPSFFPYQKTS